MGSSRQHGGALLVAVAFLLIVAASASALALAAASGARRERASERSLAQAREALIAYAADRPIDADVGPGYLPCPDLDDDGWAEPICGSLSGDLGQAERLGRLPWKTLGLPDLRDGHGERLWYAVSTRYKGLLNCAASADCVDMTPARALGTITLRSASGATLLDGTRADAAETGGAAAVVIAPGPAIERLDGYLQRRGCTPGECDARGRCVAQPARSAARCDPRNYLDRASVEDNADFHDRSDAGGRPRNANGFIAGPVHVEGRLAVNDRIVAIAYPDVVRRVMARVAVEATHCLRLHASAVGAPPEPEPRCAGSAGVGGIGDAALAERACNASPGKGWWAAWKPHVTYARAAQGGLALLDAQERPLGTGRRFAVLVTREAGGCGAGTFECSRAGCTTATRSRDRYDALATSR